MREKISDAVCMQADTSAGDSRENQSVKEQDESFFKSDFSVGEMMRIINRRAKKDNRVTYEDCKEVFLHYPRYEDFIRYGLDGFGAKHNLTERQKLVLRNAESYLCAPPIELFVGSWMGDWYSAAEILRDLFDGEPTESAYVIYLDEQMRIIDGFKGNGRMQSVGLTPDDILSHRPFGRDCCYIVAHNHVYGDYHPGMNDRRHTALLRFAANDSACRFLDSVVVAGDYVHSIILDRTIFLHPFQNTIDILKEVYPEEAKGD